MLIMRKIQARHFFALLAVASIVNFAQPSHGAEDSPAWRAEWERTLAAAKKEGKVVAGVPASADLRKAIEKEFKSRFKGIDLELVVGRGSKLARRILDEYKAGVRYFDLLISGAPSPLRLVKAGGAQPLMPFVIMPEVKDPKNWWGGHIWGDNKSSNRYIYSFQAYMPDLIWYNSNLVRPEEIRSYDDLLNSKWKGKIGFQDPRNPGAGRAIWAYMGLVKGESYLQKLAQQDLLLNRNSRQLGDFLAKGRVSLTLGLSYYSLLPYIKADLPIKPLPIPKEGINATTGSGALTVVKNPSHPNATKIFVNWLLSKQGQEVFGRAMGQPTRRLDVDTKWMTKVGVRPAKDFLTVEEYYKRQIDLEDRFTTVWRPAGKTAKKFLK